VPARHAPLQPHHQLGEDDGPAETSLILAANAAGACANVSAMAQARLASL
jgi:hypothetical protein